MPRKTLGFDAVRTIGLALGAEEGTAYGAPALEVGGKMFACLAIHRSAEPDSLVVRIPFNMRDELIASDPETYYLTDHYVDYPSVLVRLLRVHPDALRELLSTAREFVATQTPRVRKPRRRVRR